MWSSNFHLHFPKANDVKLDFPVAQTVKNLPVMQETRVWSLGWEDPLEKVMATHSSILAWRISWTEEPGRLQSLELQRVGHDWTTDTFNFYWCGASAHLFGSHLYVFFEEILVLWDTFNKISGRPVHWKLQKELNNTNINKLTDLNTQYCWMWAL